MSVCTDGSFSTTTGVLSLARAGAFRPVKTDYQAAADGPFTEHPSPGKTVAEIDSTWVNTTGVPQIVFAHLDRAPWLIIQTNRQQARFMERWSTAVGVSPKAVVPAPSINWYSSTADNPPAYVFFWVTSPSRPIVSYGAANRSTLWLLNPVRVEPGEGVNIRYIASLFTDGQPVVPGGVPKRESYARYAQLTVWAAPAEPAP